MRRIPAYVYLIILINAVILYVYCIYCHTVRSVEMGEGCAGFEPLIRMIKITNDGIYILLCHLYKHIYAWLTFEIIKRININLLLYLLFTL